MSKLPRIIKKYPNRRLYDTEQSAYITLPEVKRMVMEQKTFRVVDTKTHADLTREILLQLILEEEACSTPILTNALLLQMIRCYGGAMQAVIGTCLQHSIQSFSHAQQTLQAQVQDAYEESLALSGTRWAQLLVDERRWAAAT